MQPELLIPFALDAGGRWVAPREAVRRSSYACPDCRGRVILRAGEVKVRHSSRMQLLTGLSSRHLELVLRLANGEPVHLPKRSGDPTRAGGPTK